MMEDEEKEKNHPAVQELHRDLVKQHFATVTKQRLYTMSNGPPLEYLRHTKKEVQRFRVSLSPDQNLLLVRDASNHVVETWPLSSIVSVSSIPEDRKSKHGDWTVVLNLDKEHPLEQETESFIGATGISRSFMAKQRHNQIVLVAPSEHIQSAWIDGFSRLREAKFTSAAFADDMNMITNLEMRIRLLGLDLDTVPARPVEKPLVYPPLDGLLF